ncbi:AraC family transcriptional regulator [Burkholderia sp. F1]|uniref:AraC family transcriptional regulator n=1 Tax=Burkholderia sp. F1 TaxID=3366817 RepID=UPI003D730F26
MRTLVRRANSPVRAASGISLWTALRRTPKLSRSMQAPPFMPSPVVAPDQPSVIAGYALAIARALEHNGVDARRVLRAVGLTETVSNDPLQRLSSTQVTALYRACVEVTHDPYFGLTVGRFIHASNIHAVGYALMASRTLLDFCLRLERYFAIVSQSAAVRVERNAQEVALRFGHQTNLCGETEDAFTAFLLRFMRLLYRQDFSPLRVELHHACPSEGPKPYTQAFGVAPTFGHNESALIFSAAAVEDPLSGACAELAQYNDKIATEYLARLDHADLTARVRAKIIKMLPAGDCTRRKLAQELCMSQATLQLKLAQRGTSFQDLLSETRRELALGYLAQRSLSVTEITFLLGFTDTSNFARAFKRWTGTSPTFYRAKLLRGDAAD